MSDDGHTAKRQVANKLATRVRTPFLILEWVVMAISRATTIPASVAPKKIKTVLPTGTRDYKIPINKVQVIDCRGTPSENGCRAPSLPKLRRLGTPKEQLTS